MLDDVGGEAGEICLFVYQGGRRVGFKGGGKSLVFGGDGERAGEGSVVMGERETAFKDALFIIGGLLALGITGDFGVDKDGDGFVGQRADEKDAQRDADLGSGQADAFGVFGGQQGGVHVGDDV